MENRRAEDDRIKEILTVVKSNTKTINRLDNTIHGNGSLGLKTEVALARQSVGRLWWVGGGTVTIILGVVGLVAAFV